MRKRITVKTEWISKLPKNYAVKLSQKGYKTNHFKLRQRPDAATKVKTLTQLFDTMKESVQSGWTQSWEYIIGDFGEAKELLTGISDYFGKIIGQSSDSRNAILADWKALGGRNELINSFWNIVHSIENVVGVVRGAFEEFFPTTGKRYSITKKIVFYEERPQRKIAS